MKYIEYLNLPEVPEQLIKSLDDIIQYPVTSGDYISTQYSNVFRTHYVELELEEWLKTIFDFPFLAQYQIINQGIPIHKDKGNRLIAYNYLLVSGGSEVITSVYDDNKNLLQAENIQLKRWHRLETGYFHGVDGIDSNFTRVSISITPKLAEGKGIEPLITESKSVVMPFN